MGVGHAQPVPEIPGCAVNGEYTEENARIYYRRWAQFMNGLSWEQLMAGAVRLEEQAA
ncbi:hypothetical protein D3C81_2298130 [compost metagenome]